MERLKLLESEERETHVVDGQPVTTKFILRPETETYTWEGPTEIDGEKFTQYAGMATLKYHVVTLTWQLKFPSLPHANVAKLRRAPRVGEDESSEAAAATLAGLHEIDDEVGFRDGPPQPANFRRLPNHAQRANLRHRQNHDWRAFASEQELRRKLDAEQRLQLCSARQAAVQERERRKAFYLQGGPMIARKWERKWAEEKSLLRFADGV